MRNPPVRPLTPLDAIERWIEASVPLAPPAGSSLGTGAVLAADLRVERPVPPVAVAAIDGFAVAAEETFGASPYAPAPLTRAVALDQGDPLPAGADAVLPARALVEGPGGGEASEALAVGANVRAPGEDGREGELVRPAGTPVGLAAGMAARALGLESASVRRPALLVAAVRPGAADGPWPREVFGAFGGRIELRDAGTPARLADGLRAVDEADAVIVLGGTGEGSNDFSVAALAALGTVAFHGMALDPGESAAIGRALERPVLCLPGRPEAGLAVALTIGRALVRRLAGARPMPRPAIRGRLTRKIVASPGRTRLVYVDVDSEAVEPLGSGGLPLAALARAVGYVLLPPGSEGCPAGALIDVMPLPGYPAP